MVFARTTFIISLVAVAVAGKELTCGELYAPLGDFRLSPEQLAAGFAQQMEEHVGVRAFTGSQDFDTLVRQMFVDDLAEVKGHAIGSLEALTTQINDLAARFFADEQNYDKLDDLVVQVAQTVVRFRIGACPLQGGYGGVFSKFLAIANSKKDKTKREAKELIPLIQAKIAELSKGPHALLCSCRGVNAASYLGKAVAATADSICGGNVPLSPENTAAAVERLVSMSRVYISLFPKGASTLVSDIWEECNVKHLKGTAPAYVTKFGLKTVQEILKGINKDGQSQKDVAAILQELAYASYEEINGELTDDSGLARAQLAAGLQLDFNGDNSRRNSLLLHELLLASSADESIQLPDAEVDNVVQHFQTAFALDASELAALGALNVARGSVAQLDKAGGDASEHEFNQAKVAFLNTMNDFLATSPAGDRAQVIEAFDNHLDNKPDEYYNLFKIMNLMGLPKESASGYSFNWQRASPQSKQTMSKLYPKVRSISDFVDGLKLTLVPLSKISHNLGFTEDEEEAQPQSRTLKPTLVADDFNNSPIDQNFSDEVKEVTPVSDVDESKADKKEPEQKHDRLQVNPNFRRRDDSLGADSHYVYENRLKGCNAVSEPKKVAGKQQPDEEVNIYLDQNGNKITEQAFNAKMAECLEKAAGKHGQVDEAVDQKSVVEEAQEDPNATYTVYTHLIDMYCNQHTSPQNKKGRPGKDEPLHIYIIVSEQNPRQVVDRVAFQAAQRKCDGEAAVVAEPETGHNYTIIRLPNGCRYRSKEVEREHDEQKDQYFYQAGEIGAAKPVDKSFYDQMDRECTEVNVEQKEQQYIVTIFTVDKNCNPGASPKTVYGDRPKELTLYQRITDSGIEDLTQEQYKAIMTECQNSKLLYTEVHVLLPNGDVQTKSGYYPHKRPEGYEEVNFFRQDENGQLHPLSPQQFEQLRTPKDGQAGTYITDKLIKSSDQGCTTIERRVTEPTGGDTGNVRFIKTSRDASAYSSGQTVTRNSADQLEDGEELIDEAEYNRLMEDCKVKRPTQELDLAKVSVDSRVTISDDCAMKIDVKTTYGSTKEDKINYFVESGLGDLAPIVDTEYQKLEDKCFSLPNETEVGGKPGWASRKYVLQNCGLQIHTLTTTEKPAEEKLAEFVLMSGSRSSSVSKELFRKNWDDCKHGDFEPDFGEEAQLAIDLDEPANEYKPISFPVDDAVAIYTTETRGVTSGCKFEHSKIIHDSSEGPGEHTLTFYFKDEETKAKTDLTEEQYNEKVAKCLKKIEEEGKKAEAQKRIAKILRGSLDNKKLNELITAPDLVAYIHEHGVVEEESEDHIDQYIFVEVARESSPCHQAFDE